MAEALSICSWKTVTPSVFPRRLRETESAALGRVVRFREAGGTLGEAAVVLDGLPAQAGALYVGTLASGSSIPVAFRLEALHDRRALVARVENVG